MYADLLEIQLVWKQVRLLDLHELEGQEGLGLKGSGTPSRFFP